MRLYLVQHGDATPKDQNPERPLSDKGRTDIERMAAFLARSRMRVARVIHSGKTRARETAVLFADVLGPGKVVEEAVAGLGPNDSTDLLFQAVGPWAGDAAAGVEGAGDIMVVGHLPFMGRLLSRLVSGTEDSAIAAFSPGTVACLENTEDPAGLPGWTLVWVVRPELLGV